MIGKKKGNTQRKQANTSNLKGGVTGGRGEKGSVGPFHQCRRTPCPTLGEGRISAYRFAKRGRSKKEGKSHTDHRGEMHQLRGTGKGFNCETSGNVV